MFWPMMTSSQEPQIFGRFLGFFKEFSKIFLKIRIKIFNFSIFKDDCDSIFMAAHKWVRSLTDSGTLLQSFIGQVG